MSSFAPAYLERFAIPHGILRSVRQIGEHRGREALHERQTPRWLETLRRVAVIQSTESSNRDVEERAPGVARDMVRVVLNRFRDEGRLTCEGRGRTARWRKLGMTSE